MHDRVGPTECDRAEPALGAIGVDRRHLGPQGVPRGEPLGTLVQGGTDGFPWGAAFGVVVLYGIIAAVVALVVFRVRDIVA